MRFRSRPACGSCRKYWLNDDEVRRVAAGFRAETVRGRIRDDAPIQSGPFSDARAAMRSIIAVQAGSFEPAESGVRW